MSAQAEPAAVDGRYEVGRLDQVEAAARSGIAREERRRCQEEHTHARFGVRAERVVAHGPTPPTGLYIHGEGPVLWTEYVSGGIVPTGADFVRAVKEIAERAGVDTTPLESSGRTSWSGT